MALRERLLRSVDRIRAIPGKFGVHRYQVWVRVSTYSGTRVGLGTETVTETRLLVGGRDPHVKQTRNKDIVAGTSELEAAEFDIGPLTPEFFGGGVEPSTINPAKGTSPGTTMYLLKGPGLPSDGLLCQRVYDNTDRPFRYTIRVRSSGRKRPT